MNRRPAATKPTPSSQPRHWAAAALLSLSLAWLAGCEGVALITSAIHGPEIVPAQFVLPEATTLVLVDDPNNLLNNADLARQAGSTAVHYLRFHEAALTGTFIEPRELNRLETKLGDAWSSTPIDQIARELGAEQVIYAQFIDANIELNETLYRPHASLEVKVLNAADAERLWPPANKLVDPDKPEPGHKIDVRLGFTSRDNQYVGNATPDDLSRQIADEAGLTIARLFYDWRMPAPGDSL